MCLPAPAASEAAPLIGKLFDQGRFAERARCKSQPRPSNNPPTKFAPRDQVIRASGKTRQAGAPKRSTTVKSYDIPGYTCLTFTFIRCSRSHETTSCWPGVAAACSSAGGSVPATMRGTPW